MSGSNVYACKYCRRLFQPSTVPDVVAPVGPSIEVNGRHYDASVCPECRHPSYLTDEQRASYLPEPIPLPEGDGTGIKLERGVAFDLRGRKK